MICQDTIPVGLPADEWDPDGQEEREFMAEVFSSITEFDHERRRFHDTDSFFAHLAWSAECLALGHALTTRRGKQLDPHRASGDHTSGWDGEEICLPTRHGSACTHCEGECDFWITSQSIWEMRGVRAGA